MQTTTRKLQMVRDLDELLEDLLALVPQVQAANPMSGWLLHQTIIAAINHKHCDPNIVSRAEDLELPMEVKPPLRIEPQN